MALQDQFPQEFKAWSDAGGIADNFRRHLLGIGSLAPTAVDIQFLLAQANAALAELELAQAKLTPPLPVRWTGVIIGQPRTG